MDDVETDKRRVCRACGSEIDRCEFCDGEECAQSSCYGCVIVAIGQHVPQPHPHGG